jgi:hypothetical protein
VTVHFATDSISADSPQRVDVHSMRQWLAGQPKKIVPHSSQDTGTGMEDLLPLRFSPLTKRSRSRIFRKACVGADASSAPQREVR